MLLLLFLTLMWPPTGADRTPPVSSAVSCVFMETCLLPCSFKPGDLQLIQWIKHEGDLLVHTFQNGKDELDSQDPPFRGRTSMFPEQVPAGNASLQLSTVTVDDEGHYRCWVLNVESGTEVWNRLRVESPVKTVSMELKGDVLICTSEGIYPQPKVSWAPHSEQKPEFKQLKEKLYSVTSSITVDLHPPQQYSCNISTDHSWKCATYSLQPLIEMSTNVTIPCVTSMVPEKSLEWTFNYHQTIVTRSGTVNYTAPWRPHVEGVSETGSLILKKLSQEHLGVYECKLLTGNILYISRTVLGQTPPPPADGAIAAGISVAVLTLLLIVIVIVVLVLRRKRQKESRNKNETDGAKEEQIQLLPKSGEPVILSRMLHNTFKEMSEDELDKFKDLLMDQTLMEGFEIIPRNELENNITKALVKAYGVRSITATKRVLPKLQRNDLLEKLCERNYDPEEIIQNCKNDLKSELKEKFRFLSEGVGGTRELMEFNEGYTELFITEGDSGQVNQEHEVREMEAHSRRSAEERKVLCQELFKGQTQRGQPIRAVLTKGVAGVGKTILTKKFSLDWAEGQANQDIELLFHFTFRELNKFRDSQFSLVDLLHHCFSQTKDLCSFQGLKLLFILDGLDECRLGLDECRLGLDFRHTRVLTEQTERASVEQLLVNLIRGDLLPSARLWITTRPAAANQIPAKSVSMVTEVRGFTDEQKEQYFRKRFTDEQQATDIISSIISHIKSIRSLYIMCYIPIFCRILFNVFVHLMKTRKIKGLPTTEELPKTLTQMYIHFLVVQAKVTNQKYEDQNDTESPWTEETRKMVWSLAKLAFEQLQKRNLFFYETNLRECGLDAAKITRSGVFTQVFREEPGQGRHKVYCFIHLSVQEFMAALHVHHTFYSTGENLLSLGFKLKSCFKSHSNRAKTFYRSAVDQALKSPNGHLDLFLRFLLGLSLSTNQRLLQGLLTQTGSEQTNQETVKYIRKKLNEGGVSTERSLNLLHCLNELNDHSLLEEIQKIMRDGRLSNRDMSPGDWSAVSFILLSSDSDLEDFDLRKYCPSEKGLLGLLPVVKASTKATLSCCGLSSINCGPGAALASVLSSSSLTELDLSNNDLQDSGVELLCEGMKSAPCSLHTLRLSGCMMSQKGGTSLATALSSASFTLGELDLRYNHPGSSRELLTALQAPQGPLQTLRLDPAGEEFMVEGLRKYACEFSLDPNTSHRELLLTEDLLSVTCVRMEEEQQHPGHVDSFTFWKQVLSSSGLRGRCYWEVDRTTKEAGHVDIAVSYEGIGRRGRGGECWFGRNDQSWSLRIDEKGQCFFWHDNTNKRLGGVGVSSGRVGVFLDWEGGALSFYDVTDGGHSHIYTSISSFTEDLFPGFGLWSPGDSVTVVRTRTKPGPSQD